MDKAKITQILALAQQQILSAFAGMPDDKIGWKPLENGRSALDLFSEAAQTAGIVAQLLASRGSEQPTPETFANMRAEQASWTRETATRAMTENGARLEAALLALTPEEAERPTTLVTQGNNTWPLGLWAMMSYRMSVARFAQINYIQTLYGDFSTH